MDRWNIYQIFKMSYALGTGCRDSEAKRGQGPASVLACLGWVTTNKYYRREFMGGCQINVVSKANRIGIVRNIEVRVEEQKSTANEWVKGLDLNA